MSFLAGDLLTAQRVNRLAPKVYHVKSSGTLPASSSGRGHPRRDLHLHHGDGRRHGLTCCSSWTSTTRHRPEQASARCGRFLDGATGGSLFGIYGANITDGRSTIGNQDQFIVPTAGSHTIKLTATTPVAMTVNQYTSLKLVVSEVV
jgi:hypothetical protein